MAIGHVLVKYMYLYSLIRSSQKIYKHLASLGINSKIDVVRRTSRSLPSSADCYATMRLCWRHSSSRRPMVSEMEAWCTAVHLHIDRDWTRCGRCRLCRCGSTHWSSHWKLGSQRAPRGFGAEFWCAIRYQKGAPKSALEPKMWISSRKTGEIWGSPKSFKS